MEAPAGLEPSITGLKGQRAYLCTTVPYCGTQVAAHPTLEPQELRVAEVPYNISNIVLEIPL